MAELQEQMERLELDTPIVVTGEEPKEKKKFYKRVLNDIKIGLSNTDEQIKGGAIDAANETADSIEDLAGVLGKEDFKFKFGTETGRLATTQDPESITGSLIRGITQFAVGFAGAGKITGPLKLSKKIGVWGDAAVKSMISSSVVFDPLEERLSNLLIQYPALQNPVTEYLAADLDDTKAEGRFKNAIEDLLVNVIPAGGIILAQVLRHSTKALKHGKHIDDIVENLPENVRNDIRIAREDMQTLYMVGDDVPPKKGLGHNKPPKSEEKILNEKVKKLEFNNTISNKLTEWQKKKLFRTPMGEAPNTFADISIKKRTAFESLTGKKEFKTNKDKVNYKKLVTDKGLFNDPYILARAGGKRGIDLDREIFAGDLLYGESSSKYAIPRRYPTFPEQAKLYNFVHKRLARPMSKDSYDEVLRWMYENATGLTDGHRIYLKNISYNLGDVGSAIQGNILKNRGALLVIGSPNKGHISVGKTFKKIDRNIDVIDEKSIPENMWFGEPFDPNKIKAYIADKYPVNPETGVRDLPTFDMGDPLSLIDVSAFGGHRTEWLHRASKNGDAYQIGMMVPEKGYPRGKFEEIGWMLTPQGLKNAENILVKNLDHNVYKDRFLERIEKRTKIGEKGILTTHKLARHTFAKETKEAGLDTGKLLRHELHSSTATYLDSPHKIPEKAHEHLVKLAIKNGDYEGYKRAAFLIVGSKTGGRRAEIKQMTMDDIWHSKTKTGDEAVFIKIPQVKKGGSGTYSKPFVLYRTKNGRPVDWEGTIIEKYLRLNKDHFSKKIRENDDFKEFDYEPSGTDYLFAHSGNPQHFFNPAGVQTWLRGIEKNPPASTKKYLDTIKKITGEVDPPKIEDKRGAVIDISDEERALTIFDKLEQSKTSAKKLLPSEDTLTKGRPRLKRRQEDFKLAMQQKAEEKQLLKKIEQEKYTSINPQDTAAEEILTKLSQYKHLFRPKHKFGDAWAESAGKKTEIDIKGPEGETYKLPIGEELILQHPGPGNIKHKYLVTNDGVQIVNDKVGKPKNIKNVSLYKKIGKVYIKKSTYNKY